MRWREQAAKEAREQYPRDVARMPTYQVEWDLSCVANDWQREVLQAELDRRKKEVKR